MNRKAVAAFVPTLGMIIVAAVVLLLVAGGALYFIDTNIWTISGVAIIALALIFLGPAALKGDLTQNKIIFILVVVLGGIFVMALPSTGLVSQTAYFDETFTPIYCQDYSFMSCNEIEDSTNTYDLTDEDSWTCPVWASKCEILSVSVTSRADGTWYVGSSNCAFDAPLFGSNFFSCEDEINELIIMQPGDQLYLGGSTGFRGAPDSIGTAQVKIYKLRLDFCGRAGCTNGVPVLGANGCTFNPSATYDDSGSLVKVDLDGTSYTAQKGESVLVWNRGDRHVCGNLEEQCNDNSDCVGHTFGNQECTANDLQTYGCVNVGQVPVGIQQVEGDYVYYNTPSSAGNFDDVVTRRCELTRTEPVQCCGDTNCGSNAFCDQSTFTCETSPACTQDVDCGVSIQCDPATKELRQPTCSITDTCTFDKVRDVECCTSVQCAPGETCSEDYLCVDTVVAPTSCPFECCLSEAEYLDRPCPSGQFCTDNKCSNTPCQTDDECNSGMVCSNGNCVGKGDLDCSPFFEREAEITTTDYGFLGWRKLFNNPIQKTIRVCETNPLAVLVILGGIVGVAIVILITTKTTPKKSKKKNVKK